MKIMHLDKAHQKKDNLKYILNARTLFILFIKEKARHVQKVITELHLLPYCPHRNFQCTPDLFFFSDETPEYETTPTPRDLGTTPTPRDLGVRHNQNVDQLHSVHIRELGSESDVFQGRQSLLDWRPVYVLLYSLNQIITDSVQDSESGPGSRQTSLLGKNSRRYSDKILLEPVNVTSGP